jgi:hypothetical protein
VQTLNYWYPYSVWTLLPCVVGALVLLAGTLMVFFGCVRLLLVRHRAAGCVLGVASLGITGVLITVPVVIRLIEATWLQWVYGVPVWMGFNDALLMLAVPQDFGVVWGSMGLAQLLFALGLFLIRRPGEPFPA